MDFNQLSERIRLDLVSQKAEGLAVRKVFWMGYVMACTENHLISGDEFQRLMYGIGKLI